MREREDVVLLKCVCVYFMHADFNIYILKKRVATLYVARKHVDMYKIEQRLWKASCIDERLWKTSLLMLNSVCGKRAVCVTVELMNARRSICVMGTW